MTTLPIEFKAGQLLLITILCIYVYYTIYRRLCNRSAREALYMATLNQTLNGGGITSTTELEQLIISSQCILAFFISTGIIIVTLNI